MDAPIQVHEEGEPKPRGMHSPLEHFRGQTAGLMELVSRLRRHHANEIREECQRLAQGIPHKQSEGSGDRQNHPGFFHYLHIPHFTSVCCATGTQESSTPPESRYWRVTLDAALSDFRHPQNLYLTTYEQHVGGQNIVAFTAAGHTWSKRMSVASGS